MKTYIKVVIWSICTFIMVELITSLVSAACTTSNVIGIILLFVWIGISIFTEMFTKFKRNEKNN